MAYTLEQTPTWAVAAVCTVIVFVSVLVERLIHSLGHVRFLEIVILAFKFIAALCLSRE